MATNQIASAVWQTRPVFISSTFKDMQAERDYLRQIVFPCLEEELRKGRIILEPIDLRQGVETADLDSEAAREQLVLKVVLEEVKRSHPFLIVLLGDRYGWVPPEDRVAAAAQEAGFNTDICNKSVTALEIEYGILKQSPEQRHRSFFYFREPLPYSEMPQRDLPDYSDLYSPDPQTRARHSRLEALKQSLISDAELAPRVHTYHAVWDHAAGKVGGLEAWGEMVYQHLLDELREEIASAALQPPNTWEDEERVALAEFIEHRRRDFTGRQELLEDLTTLALSETQPGAVFAIASHVTWGACLTGEPGSGKSAIFAELATRLRSQESVVLLTNAAGATPRAFLSCRRACPVSFRDLAAIARTHLCSIPVRPSHRTRNSLAVAYADKNVKIRCAQKALPGNDLPGDEFRRCEGGRHSTEFPSGSPHSPRGHHCNRSLDSSGSLWTGISTDALCRNQPTH